MALAEGMFSTAAAAVEAQRRHKKKRHIDIETLRASRTRQTPGERARAQEIRRITSPPRHLAALRGVSVRDALREAELARITGNFAQAERAKRAAGLNQTESASDVLRELRNMLIYDPQASVLENAAFGALWFTGPLKGLGAGVKGARAVRAGKPATEVFEAVKAGHRAPIQEARQAYKARTLRIGEREQQLPKARSRITQHVIEKPADAISRLLDREAVLRVPGLRYGAASMRASKAAGREAAQETVREAAALGPHLAALKTSRRRGVDEAHFWYAQLPKSHRNVEGLKLIRAKQVEELEALKSGRVLEELNKREGALRVEAAAARGVGATREGGPLQDAFARYRREAAGEPDALNFDEFKDLAERYPNQVAPYLGEATPEAAVSAEGARPIHDVLADLQDVKALKADLPQRVEDLGKSVVRLERLAAKAPSIDERKIEALRALSEDRKKTLIEAGVLDPERAAGREGLVARWAGLEPTGEEIYMGHRLGKVRGARSSLMPVSVGTGRVRLPEGVARENKLALAKSGRLQASLQPAKEDWQAAKVYKTNLRVRGDLAQMGRPLEGTRVPEGHVLVNPKGRPVPRTWMMPEELGDGGFDPDELERAARELVDDFFAESPHAIESMLTEARKTGLWPELRVLPKEHAERYFKQFTPGARGGPVLSAYDRLVDVTAASIVFARIGYIPKNLVQNVIMAVPHQGAYLLANAVRAGQVLRDPALRSHVLGEVGFSGATRAIGKEARTQKVVGKVVGFVGSVADDPMRTSAFLHEASAEGVISRAKPILTAKDREKLLRLFTDKSQRPLLNDIRSRSVEAMADFSRMTPAQRKSARRLLIIPGWLMAGSRYPFHFAATHPVRSALLAYVAMGSPGAPEKYRPIPPVKELFAENLPPFAQGVKTPGDKVLRTTSLSPVNTPWDIGKAAIETARGNRDFGTETAFDYANPVAAAGIRFGQGEGPETFKRLAPNIGFAEGLLHPQPSKYYPEDRTRLGRLERELGILPVKIRRSAEQFSPVQRARQRVLDKRNKAWMEAQRVGLLPPGQRFGKPIRAAFNLQAKRASAYAKAGVVPSSKFSGRPYQLAAFEQDVKLAVQIGALTQAKGTQALRIGQTKTAEELEAWRRMFSEQAFGGALLAGVYAAIREAGGLE